MKTGPFCAQDGQDTATAIERGAPESGTTSTAVQTAGVAGVAAPSNNMVAMLSVILPGAGHMYKGQMGGGIAWLVGVAVGYFFIVPGLVLHVMCVLCAICGEDI